MSRFPIKPKTPNIPDVGRALNDAAKSALGQTGSARSRSSDTIEGPWKADASSFEEESFFQSLDIQGSRWDKLFPYRLVVVRPKGKGGLYEVVSLGKTASRVFTSEADGRFQIRFEPVNQSWSFQLPITPQQISISNQFAINTSATLRGVVEEHGGTKFKMISMAGTFGVWPYRGNVNPSATETPSSLQTLFGGTLQAFSSLKTNIQRTIDTFNGKNPNPRPTSANVEGTIGGYAGTGYAQALLLDQFLEQYSERKKTSEWSDYRLAFDIPKQNQTYLVTPIMFTYSQSADSPNEYKFSLQLKAFRRVKLDKNLAPLSVSVPNPLGSNTLQNVLRGLTEARRALGSAYNLVRAVRSDVNGPFNALRETTLFVKNLAGLTASAVDLPENVISDAKFAIADSLSNLNQAGLTAAAVTAKLVGDIGKVKEFKREREGLPLGTAIDENTVLSSKTSPINNLFDNPVQNFDLFNQLDVNSINFPSSVQNAIDNEINRTSLLTVDDIQRHRNTIQDLAYQISNAFGTGDDTFSRIYGRAAPKSRLQPITIDEYDILKKLYDVIQLMGVLTMTDDVQQNQNAAYEFVKAEAQDANITFEDSQSKIRAPVPFGLTIEQIAARYLGDSERWLEIVTLNALKPPYIDEVGFQKPLLSNGDGRQFNIDSAENLFIGQKIFLFSNTQPKQRRTIINIEKINDTNFLITVDGLDNLSIFTTSSSAKMQAYLPGTVNSQDQIYIPSDLPVPDDLATRPVPATKDDELTGLSKIDLLLTDDNDIAVDAFGDLRLSYGLTNIFQALKLKFITEPGQLLRFPSFGSGLRPGMSNADINAQNVYNIISALIAQDPRFAGIEKLQIIQEGPIFTVNLSVFIANGLGVYPISFKLAA
jgi:hypothetical protein